MKSSVFSRCLNVLRVAADVAGCSTPELWQQCTVLTNSQI